MSAPINSWQPIGDYNLVLAKGKGTTLQDLAGKSFATSGPGALPDQLPKMVMKKHGIDDSKSQFVQVGGHAQRLQVVLGGRADATLINTITAMHGVQDGKVTVLTRISKEFPGLGYVWNVVKTDFDGQARACRGVPDIDRGRYPRLTLHHGKSGRCRRDFA